MKVLALRKLLYRITGRPSWMLGLFAFGSRAKLWCLNPRRVLRILLLFLMIFFAFLYSLDHGQLDGYPRLMKYKPCLDHKDWLAALGILFAAVGWIVSSMMTMRNSVKQHTINTLLQTRLSQTYMSHAATINVELRGMKEAPLDAIKSEKVLPAVDYILNYLEFMAVGIRHGDLDEKMLRDTLRGIVIGFTKVVNLHIRELRKEDEIPEKRDRRAYENILWLVSRWED